MPFGELAIPSSSGLQEVGEKCAVFAAYEVEDAAAVAGAALQSMQHRGQAAAGVATISGDEISRFGGAGMVETVLLDDGILDQLPGRSAIAHNRYPTSGGNGHPQPTIENSGQFSLAHNGNLALTARLEGFLKQREVTHADLNDSELMSLAIGTVAAGGATLEEAAIEVYPLCTGAFSVVAMTHKAIIAFRDQCGIRPLSIGALNGGLVVASETCAFEDIGASFVRDVDPGEMIIIDKDGLRSHQLASPNRKHDLFELVYFSSERSTFEGRSIRDIRRRMGERLAFECPADADIVIPVPNSAIPAARGYAHASGIFYANGLYRNPAYKKRTFIEPTQEARTQGVEAKLSATPIVDGRRVVVVDDSIVRGTTTVAIINMLRRAGAREVHVRISSPPVLYPDFYGTDIPRQNTLLAHRRNIEEMRAHLGADSLGYLSLAGTIRATGQPADAFSTSCFDGEYAIPIGYLEAGISRVGALCLN